MADSDIRVHVFVEGRVQGVFFRSSVEDRANRHGITGWVKNLPDGRLEAEFQGPKDDVDELVEFCRKGPSQAHVSSVEVEERELEDGAAGFSVV